MMFGFLHESSNLLMMVFDGLINYFQQNKIQTDQKLPDFQRCACPIQTYGSTISAICSGGKAVMTFMAMVQTIINKQCDLVDPCNRVPPVTLLDEYDFIIVGAGAGGPVVAHRLSENPDWKVLLIEAGGEDPAISAVPSLTGALWSHNETDWNYRTEPQTIACQTEDEKRCSWSRGKLLGGCTTTNGMMYMRGHKKDYAGWVSLGADNWAWDNVLPYFLKSEDNREIDSLVSSEHHRQGGLVTVQRFRFQPEFAHAILKAGADLGYTVSKDLNGDEQIGFAIAQALNKDGARVNTARAFIRTAIHRPNLHVLLNAQVFKVLVNNETKVVTGVKYEHKDTVKTVLARKEVVISAGTIDSPHILLLSGIGPKETLRKFSIPVVKDLPGVGQNLQNHVGVNQFFLLNNVTEFNDLNWQSFSEYVKYRNGSMSSTGATQVTAMLNTKYADPAGDHPDVQLFFHAELADCGNGLVDTKTEKPRQFNISSIYLQPKSRGYVTLNSANPKDKPLLHPNYFHERSDLDGAIEAAKLARNLINSATMRRLGMTPVTIYDEACLPSGQVGSDAHYSCLVSRNTAPENHQAGTCRMGRKEDEMAVVDSELKVFGIIGLRVIDASVMPVVVTGNPMAPIIMIGERGADFIKQTWSNSA